MSTAQRPGIVDQSAPAWQVGEWFQLAGDQKTLTLSDLHGKVVYLYFFQSWCPGCHSHGFPALKKLATRYAAAEDVAFVAVQTVFEGFETNTLEGAKSCATKFGLTIPFGHDPGPDGKGSTMLRDYRGGGTPWTVIIDKNGTVRWNDFEADADRAGKQIEELRKIEPLVGAKFGSIAPAIALDGAIDFADSELTLIRWWTDTCPHCAASVPALTKLARATDGLRIVGMYHPKPPRELADQTIRAAAAKLDLGDGGLLAQDPEWKLLRSLQARGMPTMATSVSVLVDRAGVIRWIHGGPRLHLDSDGKHPAAEQGFRDLQRVVGAVLGAAKARSEKSEKKKS